MSIDALLHPRGVALVGASDRSYFSRSAVANAERFGQLGRWRLVNPNRPRVHGLPTVPSLANLDMPVDVALLMVPKDAIADVLAEAAGAGVRAAVVLSSGYAETGPAGRAAQRALVGLATELDVALLGPNSLGFATLAERFPVTSIPDVPDESGRVALLSQSGASAGAMVEFARTAGIGLSHLVTLGNEAMLTVARFVRYLVDDPAVAVFAVFAEAIRDPEEFRAAARAAQAAGKPIVMLKTGRSAMAARGAAAHTGAFVGDDRVVDAVLADLGVIRVDTIEELILTAGAAAQLGRLTASGLGVVSISGGACGVVADLAARTGAELPELAGSTVAALNRVLPPFATAHNPLDVTGAAVTDPPLATECVAAVGNDPAVGVVLAVNRLPWRAGPFPGQLFVDAIGPGARRSAVPVVFVNQVSQPVTAATRAALEHAGLPFAICGLGSAVTALGALARWSVRPPSVPAVSVPAARSTQPRGPWSEVRGRELLAAAGVPVVPATLATTAEEAVAAADGYGGPVAVKVVSAELTHKSDVGGVLLDVRGAAGVRAAFDAVTAAGRAAGARVDGALVGPMRAGGVELLVGVARDPDWGLMLAVGLGGVFVELLDDAVLAPLPVSRRRARDLLDSSRAARFLRGARGRPPADLDEVAGVLQRVADLAATLGDDLDALEINPLRVDGPVVEAMDVVVSWREPGGEDGR